MDEKLCHRAGRNKDNCEAFNASKPTMFLTVSVTEKTFLLIMFYYNDIIMSVISAVLFIVSAAVFVVTVIN